MGPSGDVIVLFYLCPEVVFLVLEIRYRALFGYRIKHFTDDV